jgi:hypothetical protein
MKRFTNGDLSVSSGIIFFLVKLKTKICKISVFRIYSFHTDPDPHRFKLNTDPNPGF